MDLKIKVLGKRDLNTKAADCYSTDFVISNNLTGIPAVPPAAAAAV